MRSVRARSVPTLALLLLAAPALALTKIVDVGPNNTLTFADEESGTDTTTVSVGDTVNWRWMSSGHSTTRTDSPEAWDSGVQDAPFAFSHTFTTPGTFPYHCTTHQFLGMTGTVVVQAGGPTTTTTLPPPACTDAEALTRTRAAVDAQCDCAGASHRSYVKCAVAVAKAAVRAGTLPKTCRGKVKRCAAHSTCGRPGFATCCLTTAQGVQQCSIKPSAAACRPPPGGIACVGDRSSCCGACGGTTCPRPPTTTTTSTPGENGPTTTTSTTPSTFNPCGRLAPCAGGVCVTPTPTFCPDGTPALWFGTAASLAGSVNVVFTFCAFDPFVSGTFFCPSSVPCLIAEGVIFGTTFVTVDGVAIVFDPLTFADGDSCTFDGWLGGLTMTGNFLCVDPFGFPMTAGTWGATRCP